MEKIWKKYIKYGKKAYRKETMLYKTSGLSTLPHQLLLNVSEFYMGKISLESVFQGKSQISLSGVQ